LFQVKERWLNGTLILLLVTNTLLVLQLEFPGPDGVYMASFVVVTIYISFALEEITKRFFQKPIYALVLLAIPALYLTTNYNRVDQSQHTLHAEIVEKILVELDDGALIIADEYEYATYFWYYLIGEGQSQRNIYALPDFDTNAQEIGRYLREEEGMHIWQQRLTVPPGFPVYTLWKIAPKLESMGFQVQETGLKYLYVVKLPEG
jgi:energy-coupling factor transporter transmembrane protein EcfT